MKKNDTNQSIFNIVRKNSQDNEQHPITKKATFTDDDDSKNESLVFKVRDESNKILTLDEMIKKSESENVTSNPDTPGFIDRNFVSENVFFDNTPKTDQDVKRTLTTISDNEP